MFKQKKTQIKIKQDWDRGVRLQLLRFRSFPIKKKIKIVEDMEIVAQFMQRKKKQRLGAAQQLVPMPLSYAASPSDDMHLSPQER
jgi:hypothetical protein